MKPGDDVTIRERHRTQCSRCGLVQVRRVWPTLSSGIYFGGCSGCGRESLQRELPGELPPEEPIVSPKREVDLEELLGPGDRFLIGEGREISRAEALAALESGEDGGTIRALGGEGEEALEGDPSLCPECGESGRHDVGCPFPGRLHQAYLLWRGTEDGQAVVESIRRRALELRSYGWHHYGIQALAEVARFDRALLVGPDAAGFKVNNSHLSRLARDLMRESPDLVDFFEIRELRSIR